MIPIDKNARTRNNVTNLDDVRQARAQSETQHNEAEATKPAANNHVEVLSKTNTQTDDRHGNRRFDAEKVAKIKAAIASGEYVIDPSRIADRFIEHDRNQ